MNLGKTTTSVHTPDAQIRQRWEARIRDEYKLSALCLALQLWMGYCMYLMDHVSTPAYISILLLLLPLCLLYWLFGVLNKSAAQSDRSLLTALLPRWLGRSLEYLLALSLFLDAVIILYNTVSLIGEVLPTLRRWLLAPLYSLLCCASVCKNRHFSLSRLAALAFLPLLLVLLLSPAAALNQGSINHFFPLWGMGSASVLHGSVWMCAALTPALVPALLPGKQELLARMRSGKHIKSLGLLLCGFLFSVFISLLYTYLMPPFALSRPLSFGLRLLLPASISSSIPGWTLFVCGQLFLSMIAYTASLSRSAVFLQGTLPQKANWLLPALFLLTLPVPMLYSQSLQHVLMQLAPWRLLPYLLALVAAACSALLHRGRKRR